MKLEDQVTSLELSNKLKELGIKQESCFYWYGTDSRMIPIFWSIQPEINIPKFSNIGKESEFCYSAFTVAELIELLGDKFGVLERFPHSGKFGAYIPNDIGTSATGEKVVDVLAELLIRVFEANP